MARGRGGQKSRTRNRNRQPELVILELAGTNGIERGNQREKDRERAQARNPGKGKSKEDGLTPEQRRERDGKALQEKAAKKAAQAATGGGDAGELVSATKNSAFQPQRSF
ncbi:hypothetical protein R6Q57_017175 [Mikania cordata]